MKEVPLVSIIIPCYNSEKYVSETLDSVIQQTYENWECIIVDDHSTDSTWDILESYKQQFQNRIFLYKNPRKGACSARNVGLEHSKGRLIQFLDSDDILFPNKITSQVRLYTQFGDTYIYTCKWGILQNNIKTLYNEYSLYGNLDVINFYKKMYLTLGAFLPPHCFLIPTSIIRKHAIIWNEKILQNQDGVFFTEILTKSDGIKMSEDAYVLYRRDNLKSLSRNRKREVIQNRLYSYKEIFLILKNLNNKYDVNDLLHIFISKFYCEHKYTSSEFSSWCKSKLRVLEKTEFIPIGGNFFTKLARLIGLEATIFFYKIKNYLF